MTIAVILQIDVGMPARLRVTEARITLESRVRAEAQVRTPVFAREDAASLKYFISASKLFALSLMICLSLSIVLIVSSFRTFFVSLARAVLRLTVSADASLSSNTLKVSPKTIVEIKVISIIDIHKRQLKSSKLNASWPSRASMLS